MHAYEIHGFHGTHKKISSPKRKQRKREVMTSQKIKFVKLWDRLALHWRTNFWQRGFFHHVFSDYANHTHNFRNLNFCDVTLLLTILFNMSSYENYKSLCVIQSTLYISWHRCPVHTKFQGATSILTCNSKYTKRRNILQTWFWG